MAKPAAEEPAEQADDLFGRWLAHREKESDAADEPQTAGGSAPTPPETQAGTPPARASGTGGPVVPPSSFGAPRRPPAAARAHENDEVNELDRVTPHGFEPIILRSTRKRTEAKESGKAEKGRLLRRRRATRSDPEPGTEGAVEGVAEPLADLPPPPTWDAPQPAAPAPAPGPTSGLSPEDAIAAALASAPPAPVRPRPAPVPPAPVPPAVPAPEPEPQPEPEPPPPALGIRFAAAAPVEAPPTYERPDPPAASPVEPTAVPAPEPAAETGTKSSYAPPAPTVPEMPPVYEFQPIKSSRRILTVLFMIGLVATGWLGWTAYQSREEVVIGVTIIVGLTTLIIWGVRAGANPIKLTVRDGQLEVKKQGNRFVFDLASTYTPIEVVGEPRDRSWKVLIMRRGMAPFTIDATMVNPDEFMRVLRFFRPERPD